MILPIHHTFGPHIDKRFLQESLKILCTPWRWKNGTENTALEKDLQGRFSKEAVTFGSGRQSLLALLQAINIKQGDEIIVQAYTCVVVPNAIHAANAIAIYADIEQDTLNLDVDDVQRRLSPKTKAIICQHTFGIPSDTKRLRQLCDRHGILLIEDCAHILPDATGPKAIGSLGDAMLVSFGRDKAISGVAGGAMLVKNPEIATKLRALQGSAKNVSLTVIAAYMLYPLAYACARPLLQIGIGKVLLIVLRKLGLLIPIIQQEEKDGHQPLTLEKVPNACARLARAHLARLQELNDHRRMLTSLYREHGIQAGWPVLSGITHDLPLQKFPMFVTGAQGIRKALKSQGIYLDDGWTGCVVCPYDIDRDKTGYTQGTDPVAEDTCERILSLPTHPTMTINQAEYLMKKLDGMHSGFGKNDCVGR